MTQKNEMSARALNMEELENVNGGLHNCDRIIHRRVNRLKIRVK